jgi:hypothetical protein
VLLIYSFKLYHPKNDSAFYIPKNEISSIQKNVQVSIYRYEKDLFSADITNLPTEIEKLSHHYPEILIAKEVWNDPEMVEQLQLYLQDPIIQGIFKETQQVIPNVDLFQNQLSVALIRYLYYFPDATIPVFYTLIPGIDINTPSVYGFDNDVFINIDMYLGENYKLYGQYGMPKYISERCNQRYLLIDCFKNVIVYRHLPEKSLSTLLDYMIFEGKKLYFTKMMLPDTLDRNIIGYNQDKFVWAEKNQQEVWNYIIEKGALFSHHDKELKMYINETPYTKIFGNQSPGRLGTYIGWQIVKSYMEHNKDVTIQELLNNTNADEILKLSKYKPIRR